MKKGFTLAEVLITLAIIGVVAALTIPSVIINAREQGNITAFKKAISVINSAISLNIAVDMTGPNLSGEPASSADNIIKQLSSKMNVIQNGLDSSNHCTIAGITNEKAVGTTDGTAVGCSFTTADGFQFILPTPSTITSSSSGPALEYKVPVELCLDGSGSSVTPTSSSTNSTFQAACQALGSSHRYYAKDASVPASNGKTSACTAAQPCFIVVDVNGQSAPNKMSSNVNEASGTITDRFAIAITDDGAMAAGEQAKSVMAK